MSYQCASGAVPSLHWAPLVCNSFRISCVCSPSRILIWSLAHGSPFSTSCRAARHKDHPLSNLLPNVLLLCADVPPLPPCQTLQESLIGVQMRRRRLTPALLSPLFFERPSHALAVLRSFPYLTTSVLTGCVSSPRNCAVATSFLTSIFCVHRRMAMNLERDRPSHAEGCPAQLPHFLSWASTWRTCGPGQQHCESSSPNLPCAPRLHRG